MHRAPFFVVLAFAAGPPSAAGQRFDVGRLPTGIDIELDEEPYTIDGGTAQRILEQLVLRGPGRSWISFPLFFLWETRYEELPLGLRQTQGSQLCQVERFEAHADFQAAYPSWDRPADAPEALAEAWAAFQLDMERLWGLRRSAVLRFFTELTREARRVQAGCGFIQNDLRALVDERLRAFNEAEEAAAGTEERMLRWPPEGFGALLAQPAPLPGRQPAAAPRSPERPPVIPYVQPDPTAVAGDLGEAVDLDMRSGSAGIVVGLIENGELRYFDAINGGSSTAEPVTVESTTEFRGLTPLLVATLAHALAARGVLDLGAPISRYLPEVDPTIGAVTLDQLLAHRSGIDSATPREGETWAQATAALDRHALFTEPGAVFSLSPYNDLLTVGVIERVLNRPLADALQQALFGPLGLTATSLGPEEAGLPTTRTRTADVLQLLISWLNGQLSGMPLPPRTIEPDASTLMPERVFRSGVWRDQIGGQPRMYRICDGAGFEVLPASNSIFVAWARRGWPSQTARFLLAELGEELGMGTELIRPTGVRGAATAMSSTHCAEPDVLRELVEQAGLDAAADDWAGRYTNGERFFLLEERGGVLKVPGETMLDVSHYRGDVYLGSLEGRPILSLRLHRDRAARRYVILDERAYVHDDDRPSP